jgi:hypothetical protein
MNSPRKSTARPTAPSHVLELLFELHDQNAPFYDALQPVDVDLEQVRAHFFSDNTRERIERQPKVAGRNAGGDGDWRLRGRQLDAASLQPFLESPQTIAGHLRKAVGEGLIGGLREDQERGMRYQFAHPRVCSLIYQRINDAQADIHLVIADALIHTDTAGTSAKRIADQFNAAGGPFDTNAARRNAIAHYNLLAAREALVDGDFSLRSVLPQRTRTVSESAPAARRGSRTTGPGERAGEAAFSGGRPSTTAFARADYQQVGNSSALTEMRVRAALAVTNWSRSTSPNRAYAARTPGAVAALGHRIHAHAAVAGRRPLLTDGR